MVDKRRIAISAGSSIAQVIISGLTIFLLYRYLLEVIGPEKLGIWALVLSASSMVQGANLGMTGSIVKHIADYDALGDQRKISLATQTAVISIAAFSFVFVAGLFPAAKYYFQFTLEGQFYRDALEILPLALVSFWIYMLIGIYMGALYGCQRIVQRNGVLVADSISHLGLCVILTPHYGLLGLAYARVIQNCLTLVVTVVLLRRYVRGMPVLPYCWRKDLFKEMFSYAVNFQVIAILVMLSDPVTKGFLSKYGQISMVAYYEMANKLVQLFRSLMASANQVLVPTFAHLNQLDPKKISNIYLASYQLIFYLSFPVFFLLAVSAPLVSEIWVGHNEPIFIWAVVLLCSGWLPNVLSLPAYYAGLGTGDMRSNVVTHLVITAINIVLILIVGRLWEGMGVIVAWAVALVCGGVLLNLLYFRINRISLHNIIPRSSRYLAVSCILGLFISYWLWLRAPVINEYLLVSFGLSDLGLMDVTGIVMIIFFLVIVAIPVWRHPIRKSLMNWVVNDKS